MAATIEVYEAEDGWRWRCRGANGEIVIPPEAHRDPTDAARAADTARRLMVTAVIEDPVTG